MKEIKLFGKSGPQYYEAPMNAGTIATIFPLFSREPSLPPKNKIGDVVGKRAVRHSSFGSG